MRHGCSEKGSKRPSLSLEPLPFPGGQCWGTVLSSMSIPLKSCGECYRYDSQGLLEGELQANAN